MRHLVAALSVIVSAGLLASATLDTCALAAPGKSKDPAAQADRALAKLVKKLTKKAQRESRARSKAFSKRVRSIARAIETGKGLDELLAEAGVEGGGASVARKGADPGRDPAAVIAMALELLGDESVDAQAAGRQEFTYGRDEVRAAQASSTQRNSPQVFEYARRTRRALNEESSRNEDDGSKLARLLFTIKNDRDDKGHPVALRFGYSAYTINENSRSQPSIAFVAAGGDIGVKLRILPSSPEFVNQTVSVILGDEGGTTLASTGVSPAQTPKGNSYFSADFSAPQVDPGHPYELALLINDGDREWCESRICFYVPPLAADPTDPTDPPAHDWPETHFVDLTLGGVDHPVSFPSVAQIRASGDELRDAYFQFDAGDPGSFGVVVTNLFDLTTRPAEIHASDGKWFVCLDQDSGLSIDFHKFDPNGGQALDAGFLIGDYTVKLYFADDPGKPHPAGYTTQFHMIIEGTLAQIGDTVGSPYRLEMHDDQFTFQILGG